MIKDNTSVIYIVLTTHGGGKRKMKRHIYFICYIWKSSASLIHRNFIASYSC